MGRTKKQKQRARDANKSPKVVGKKKPKQHAEQYLPLQIRKANKKRKRKRIIKAKLKKLCHAGDIIGNIMNSINNINDSRLSELGISSTTSELPVCNEPTATTRITAPLSEIVCIDCSDNEDSEDNQLSNNEQQRSQSIFEGADKYLTKIINMFSQPQGQDAGILCIELSDTEDIPDQSTVLDQKNYINITSTNNDRGAQFTNDTVQKLENIPKIVKKKEINHDGNTSLNCNSKENENIHSCNKQNNLASSIVTLDDSHISIHSDSSFISLELKGEIASQSNFISRNNATKVVPSLPNNESTVDVVCLDSSDSSDENEKTSSGVLKKHNKNKRKKQLIQCHSKKPCNINVHNQSQNNSTPLYNRQSTCSFIGDNFYNAGCPERKGLRPIIIDGCNVAMSHSNNKVFSVRGLEICIHYFLKRGHKVKAFVPHFRTKSRQSNDPILLQKLYEHGHVILTPSREVNGRFIVSYDDRFIVQTAAVLGGIIVSCDHYRDLMKENPYLIPVIEKQLLMPTWFDDMIIFPNDPLGRNGPDLNTFLRFP